MRFAKVCLIDELRFMRDSRPSLQCDEFLACIWKGLVDVQKCRILGKVCK